MINCGTLGVFLGKRALPYIGLDVHMYVKCLEIETTGLTLLPPTPCRAVFNTAG